MSSSGCQTVTSLIKTGCPQVVACPTESVYGLGCSPFDQEAVDKILAWKNKGSSKGLIVVAACFSQVADWCEPVDAKKMQRIEASWPGPTSWIFPASNKAPSAAVCVATNTIAVRVSDHSVLCQMAHHFGPMISTSANWAGLPPARTVAQVKQYFPELACIVAGDLGKASKPSAIYDVATGKCLRA
jgi:L-threonylcarbamoyladenylate synthase